jgi:uncharacterized membrane protein
MNYELFIRLMAPYHSVLVHFPVAIWTTTALVVVFRVFFDNSYAQAAGKLLPLLVLLGIVSGTAAFIAGFFIFSPTAAGASPLIRNHILAGSWAIGYWTMFMVTCWRLGSTAWHGGNRWMMLGLAALGTLLITVTGTIGGHIAGNPTSVSLMLEAMGWDVHDTFFVPNAMLIAIVVGAIALPVIGWIGRRRHAARAT